MPAGARLDYLRLWSQSGLSVRRRFYRSSKAMIMVSAYSMEEFWKVIGYEGPLVTGHDQA